MATLSRAANGHLSRPFHPASSTDYFVKASNFQAMTASMPMLFCNAFSSLASPSALHSAQDNVAASFEVLDVQPDRDVGQLSPLQLVDGACIPRPRRVARDAAAVFRIFGQGEEGKILARGRGHAQAAGSRLRTVASMPLTKSIALFTLRVRWRRIPA